MICLRDEHADGKGPCLRREVYRVLGVADSVVPVTVGIGEMQISDSVTDVLVTHSLGSCVGVSAYDPGAKVGGMIHCMLPLSKADSDKAVSRPCMFVDSGVTLFLNSLFALGARKSRLVVCVAGASRIIDRQDMFQIGERNCTVLRKILWKNGILIASEDTGATLTRTLWLSMATGQVVVRSQDSMSLSRRVDAASGGAGDAQWMSGLGRVADPSEAGLLAKRYFQSSLAD